MLQFPLKVDHGAHSLSSGSRLEVCRPDITLTALEVDELDANARTFLHVDSVLLSLD